MQCLLLYVQGFSLLCCTRSIISSSTLWAALLAHTTVLILWERERYVCACSTYSPASLATLCCFRRGCQWFMAVTLDTHAMDFIF
ncbi:hypothetical protein BDY19DRAFT_281363 [Irpex rosettiformis]|uniref:Uncharacterized protein n=1 Tax=Irpex rosettiformis TaxID=378272 RepID=A0ACB8UHN2_9APHY|nr:hypothetical protein BDY19DRAFT_281363 [Irpex rosettiformis]